MRKPDLAYTIGDSRYLNITGRCSLRCRPAIPGSYLAMLDFLPEAPRYIRDVSASAIDGLDGVDIDACRRLAEQRGTRFKRRVLDVVG